MQDATTTTPFSSTPAAGPVPLVRHSKKQEWGRALLLWRRDEKRAYQFEDGSMRVFAERFCGFFEPAAQPDPVLRQRLRDAAVAGGHVTTDAAKTKGGRAKANLRTPTVADQIEVFRGLFDGGFEGATWRDALRSRERGKALKRHLDPVIADAKQTLHVDVLRSHIETGNPGAVLASMLELVARTTMATSAQRSAFAGLPADPELATALVDFLHDVGGHARGPLDRLRMVLAKHGLKNVPWTVLTGARALVHPETHLYVRPSAMRAQLKLLMPSFSLPSVPQPDAYARCLEAANGVRKSLSDAGLSPRDLFDVAEFMRVTLSKANRDELTAAMEARLRPADAPAVH